MLMQSVSFISLAGEVRVATRLTIDRIRGKFTLVRTS